MKIKVRTVIGGHERVFDMPCGEGDKSFKWLSNCAAQRFALSAPNGALRRKEGLRGITKNAQATPTYVVLPNGDSPHPLSRICDFLVDGETVTIEMINSMECKGDGNPRQAEWSTLAFTVSSAGGEMSQMMDFASSQTGVDEDYTVESEEVQNARKGNALFMKSILNSQRTDEQTIMEDIDDRWVKIKELMPNFPKQHEPGLKAVFAKYWPLLVDVYQNYAPLNAMMKREMTETDYFHFVEDAEIFAVSEFELMTKRSFRRVARGQRFIDLGDFMACLLLVSQAKHNDIFDKEQINFLSPIRAVEAIIGTNIMKLAQNLNVTSFIRYCMFNSDVFLSTMRKMHEELFLVFEKYCAKGVREIALTLTMELMGNLLDDCKLVPEDKAVEVAEQLFKACNNGMINGRVLPEEIDLPPPPDDEFTFAEFIEGICRVAFVEDGKLESKKQAQIIEEIIETCTRVKDILYYVEPQVAPAKAGKK